MFSIKWMAKNTPFRAFTAYSDPEAKELGTIYQACNFYYIGQSSGSQSEIRPDSIARLRNSDETVQNPCALPSTRA